MKKLVMLSTLALLLWSCNSGSKKSEGESFKYLVDEFADIKIIRYQIPNWEQLSLQQKSISTIWARLQRAEGIFYGIKISDITWSFARR